MHWFCWRTLTQSTINNVLMLVLSHPAQSSHLSSQGKLKNRKLSCSFKIDSFVTISSVYTLICSLFLIYSVALSLFLPLPTFSLGSPIFLYGLTIETVNCLFMNEIVCLCCVDGAEKQSVWYFKWLYLYRLLITKTTFLENTAEVMWGVFT